MPIKGLTTQEAHFPKIGTLRKGAAKAGNRPGKDLDYFRFDSQDNAAIAAFQAKYGDQPREVNILLPHNDIDQNLFAYFEEWGSSGLHRRCDGENIVAQRDQGRLNTQCMIPCFKTKGQECNCKAIGRLSVVIPELQRFAYVTVTTTSEWDLIRLSRQMAAIQTTFGRLKGIPLVLRRTKETISVPMKDGQRSQKQSWLLSIEVEAQWSATQLQAARQHQLHQARHYMLDGSLPSAYELPVSAVRSLPSAPVEELPKFDFLKSEEWYKFTCAMSQAHKDKNPKARIEYLATLARQRVDDGLFPKHAHGAIDREVTESLERLNAIATLAFESVQAELLP